LSALIAINYVYFLVNPVYFTYSFMLTVFVLMIIAINLLDNRSLRFILYVALVLRISYILYEQYTGIILFGMNNDIGFFEEAGWENALAWLSGLEAVKITDVYYYSAVIGFVYYFFGRVPLLIQSISLLIGVFIVYLNYLITLDFSASKQAATLAALLTAVFPPLVIFSSVIMREVYMIGFIMLSFYFFLRWLKSRNQFFVIGSFLSTISAGLFHGAMLLANGVHYFYYAFYSPAEKRLKIFSSGALIIILFSFAMTVVLATGLISYKIPSSIHEVISLQYFQQYVGERVIGRTHYLDGLIPENYFDLIWQTPIRTIYFLFAPFPWMVADIKDFYGLMENSVYLVFLIISAQGFKAMYRRNSTAVINLWAIVITIVIIFAWGTVNYGTAWRHKAKIAPFLIVAASTGAVLNTGIRKYVKYILLD
jgi:hypothetical protein